MRNYSNNLWAVALSSTLLAFYLALPTGAFAAETTAPKLEPTFSKPGLIAAAGQSSDIAVVKALLNIRLKLGLEVKPAATAADLGEAKTLIVVLGASSKGMGAAGIDLDKEIDRSRKLVQAAKEKKIKVLGLHVGGESRRGKITNDLLEVVVPECTHVVVVASGNKDKMFDTLAAKNNVPLTEVQNLAAAGDAVKALFVQ